MLFLFGTILYLTGAFFMVRHDPVMGAFILLHTYGLALVVRGVQHIATAKSVRKEPI